MRLLVVTRNPGKAVEIAAFFRGILEIDPVEMEIPEHRSENICEIARKKASDAYHQLEKPLLVDDTGFFIDALRGFPGPYAAYVQDTLGNSGILKLLEGETRRSARFVTAVAYADTSGIAVFSGILEGSIANTPRGSNGFGYDPIFETGSGTLAELSLNAKMEISHRSKALAAFRTWFLEGKRARGADANG